MEEEKGEFSKGWLFFAISLVLMGSFVYTFKSTDLLALNLPDGADKKGLQAVFLTNDQVYFGNLRKSGTGYSLSNVFYLQMEGSVQKTSPQGFKLIKLGNELHGPKDEMFLEKDKILFWENLRENSRIVEAIRSHQSESR